MEMNCSTATEEISSASLCSSPDSRIKASDGSSRIQANTGGTGATRTVRRFHRHLAGLKTGI